MSTFEDVRVGDQVIYWPTYEPNMPGLTEVVRVTKTLIVLTLDMKFKKRNGRLYGSSESYYRSRIELPTKDNLEKMERYIEERKDTIERGKLMNKIYAISWKGLSLKQLRAIVEVAQ